MLEIAKSLVTQCSIRQGNLCTANQLDLFTHFDTVRACDSQRDQTLPIAYTHYAHVSCGKNNITQYNGHLVTRYCSLAYYMSCLQCFDTLSWLGDRKGIRPVKNGGWWRWALVSLDGVAPSPMVNVSASVNLPMHLVRSGPPPYTYSCLGLPRSMPHRHLGRLSRFCGDLSRYRLTDRPCYSV